MQLLVSGAGLVVTELTLHSDNQSLNPVQVSSFCKFVIKGIHKIQKRRIIVLPV